MSLEEAAKALSISNPERLANLEAGTEEPPRSVLLRMAKQYHRSLLTFYLAAPPRRGDRGEDFRTLPPERAIEDEAALDALIRDLRARQTMVRSIVEEEESPRLEFIGSMTMNSGVDAVVASIRTVLGADHHAYRSRKSYDDAFAFLRGRTETAGVFVLLVGNLGSYHSAIPVETFRGFAIADQFAPFVVINDQDARPAWTFTLLHELAHLWLGTTGVSGASAEKAIEQFCNDVAGEFLLPKEELASLAVNGSTDPNLAIQRITEFARDRYVSRAMVAYKLLRSKRINWQQWRALDAKIHQIWLQEKEKRKNQQQQSDSGPSYYVVRRHRAGNALLRLVSRTIDAGMLTPVRAARVLGVKPRSVFPLLVDAPHG
jgi:Zn-dependent peptidase ImmA (M78 family)